MITIKQFSIGTAMLGALSLGILASTAARADYRAGQAAYDKGDYVVAVEAWRAAAAEGDARAMTGLGEAYFNGKGVERNRAEALRLFKRSADLGDARGQYDLAVMYEKSLDMTPDYAEAVRLYALASHQGHRSAPHNLALMYYSGVGMPVDKAEAAKWYRVGAQNGRAYSAFNLGYMYARGEGVKKDAVEARMFLRIARLTIDGKNSTEDNLVTRIDAEVAALEKHMTAAQIKEAKMRVIEWEERYPRSR